MSDHSSSNEPHRDPAERGRLGFSRTALSMVGVLAVIGFLMWFFFFV